VNSELHTIEIALRSADREAIRREVVGWWLDELPGITGTRNCYRYYVERLADGSRIYLDRPTRLNKGMDFVIKCENYIFYKNGNCKPPSHRDLTALVTDLTDGNRARLATQELRRALGLVWKCADPTALWNNFPKQLQNEKSERLLKLARWFFIEQDLTYWTESGRWMLRGSLESLVGAFE
jgi:hypothetical protein